MAQRPLSSKGARLRNGVRQATQKYSATNGSGSFRQREQTGIREISRRGSPQTRQSSGKTNWNRPQHAFSATRSTPPGKPCQSSLRSRLLEKTHLHLTFLVYNNSRDRDLAHVSCVSQKRPKLADALHGIPAACGAV